MHGEALVEVVAEKIFQIARCGSLRCCKNEQNQSQHERSVSRWYRIHSDSSDYFSRNKVSGNATSSADERSGFHATRPSVRIFRTVPCNEPFRVRTRSPGFKSAA